MIIGFDGSRSFIDKKTGTENYAHQLLIHLAKIDTRNTYKIYLRPHTKITKSDWPDNFEFITIRYPRLWTQAGLAKQTFKDKLDVLFVPSHTFPLIKRPGLKTVMTIHDLGAEYLPKHHQLKQRLYLHWITNHQIKSATHLIAVSEATKKDLQHKVHIPAKKISVVYEGLNTVQVSKSSKTRTAAVLEKYRLKSGQYFLFVGTIQPRKNLERLIEAFDLYLKRCGRDDTLVLAGGKGWLSEKIYATADQLGIENKVKFLGYVPDENLPALYQSAIAFVYPSLFEGFGLPILEAFAHDCPVLTSTVSSMPEVAGKGAVYVDPYDVDCICKGLLKIRQPEVREWITGKGQKQLEKFSWEKAAEETLAVLEKVGAKK